MFIALSRDYTSGGRNYLFLDERCLVTDMQVNHVEKVVNRSAVSTEVLLKYEKVRVMSCLIDKELNTCEVTLFSDSVKPKGVISLQKLKELEAKWVRSKSYLYYIPLRLSDQFSQILYVFKEVS